ncbi:hypothetical protein HYR99_25150 [Candidatus Poribacteria bacterium]|nr:hypothetical protein [Candidatus Poribacteria bacterium]
MLEEIAREYELSIDREVYVYLDDDSGRTVASINDLGLENDICINPDYDRGGELLFDLGTRLFGASTEQSTQTTEGGD